jgi:hypothetical protein
VSDKKEGIMALIRGHRRSIGHIAEIASVELNIWPDETRDLVVSLIGDGRARLTEGLNVVEVKP